MSSYAVNAGPPGSIMPYAPASMSLVLWYVLSTIELPLTTGSSRCFSVQYCCRSVWVHTSSGSEWYSMITFAALKRGCSVSCFMISSDMRSLSSGGKASVKLFICWRSVFFSDIMHTMACRSNALGLGCCAVLRYIWLVAIGWGMCFYQSSRQNVYLVWHGRL